MKVSLSDVLTCPRCGPAHGLVLLPDVVRERRVQRGVLGCPNCRERYPIAGGVAELEVPQEVGALAPWVSGDPGGRGPAEWAYRLGGLLGLDGAPGLVLVAGPASAGAGELARVAEGAEVVVLEAAGGARAGTAGGGVGAGVVGSVIRVGGMLPFRTGSARGVALTGGATALAAEGLRVLGPSARMLLEPSDAGLRSSAESAGGVVVVDEGGTLVVSGGA